MIFAVINEQTSEQVNLIVAQANDLPPTGCRLVEMPDGFMWDGAAVVPVPVGVEENAS